MTSYVDYRLLFLGNKFIVPKSVHTNMLELISEGHLGMAKCIISPRELFYWPQISKDIGKFNKNPYYHCKKYQSKKTNFATYNIN